MNLDLSVSVWFNVVVVPPKEIEYDICVVVECGQHFGT